MNTRPKISVIIVNFNTGRLLEGCLASVLSRECDVLEKIIVVDNASSDGSTDFLTSNPDVICLRNAANFGFATACNQGAAIAESEFLLFLNPDTLISPDSVLALVMLLSTHEHRKVAVCGLKQVDEYGNVSKHCCKFPNLFNFAARSIGMSAIFPRSGHVMVSWDHLESRVVDHVIGSCYAIRRDIFEVLNGFDEQFFLYYEDLDLSYRVRQLGWKSFYLADHDLRHYCGGSSKNVPEVRLFRSLQSKVIYVRKHLGVWKALTLLIINFSFELPIRCLVCVLTLRFNDLKNTISAFWHLLKWSLLAFSPGQH